MGVHYMQCKKCGQQLADNATLCTSCGWKTANWQHEVKRAKTIHIGVIVASALLLAALIIIFIRILNLTIF